MANYRLFATQFGMPFTHLPAPGAINLNAAASWGAVSFVAPVSSTLNSVRTYVTGKTGTLVAADSTINIFSAQNLSSAYSPNSSLAGPTSCDSAITGAGWYNWTPSYSVTRGTRYFVVFKNANATPASNFYTLRAGSLMGYRVNPGGSTAASAVGDCNWRQTSNSGSTWTSLSAGTLRLGFSDGSYWGFPWSDSGADSTNTVYSTREVGSVFTLPTNLSCKVIGVGIMMGTNSGSPTGTTRLRLYTGSSPSLQATGDFSFSNISGMHFAYFSSAVTLTGGTICRVVLSETTQSDTSANVYRVQRLTIDTDSNSTGLFPYSSQQTYYDGSSWTQTSSAIVPYCLLLDDTSDEFQAGGSSSVIVTDY